jgi:uncharacterized protein
MERMDKLAKLNEILKGLGSVVVAYSGGLDSTLLLKVAIDALGAGNVLAVTARSETYPDSEYREACRMAKRVGARHLTMRTSELAIKNFKENPVNRCYYCKKELFTKLDDISRKRGMMHVIDGTNFDDRKDIRYGRIAAMELGVKSPLLDARITKNDIRALSRRFSLPTWDKPSYACLASRIPFHETITATDLKRVGVAEEFLRGLGLRQVRLRVHNDIARLEFEERDFAKVLRYRGAILKRLRKLGFIYVTIDLAGYRTGSMHEAV